MEFFNKVVHYFLNTRPNPDFYYVNIVLIIGLALIFLGIVWELYRKHKMSDKIARKILRPYPGKLIRYGFLVLFLLAVRMAGLSYLSMRLWWLVLGAFMLYSLLKLILTYGKEYRKRQEKVKVSGKEDKYLPKKKK